MSKRSARKTNTHDPSASERKFIAAVEAANRELLNANEALERGKWANSLKLLGRAAYWIGQARSERVYAARIDPGVDKHLRQLEKGMDSWGKYFLDAQRKDL